MITGKRVKSSGVVKVVWLIAIVLQSYYLFISFFILFITQISEYYEDFVVRVVWFDRMGKYGNGKV